MNTEVMFSSATDQWETPQPLFDRLDRVFHFETDVCALPENAKCERYFTPEMDGLKQEWKGRCWMNPPYGKQIGQWVHKALQAAGGGRIGCLPSSRANRYSVVSRLCSSLC